MGRYPVEDQDTATVACYRFSYDEKGKLTGWVYLKGGNPAPDPVYAVVAAVIHRQSDTITTRFQDRFGQPALTSYGIFASEIILDKKGFPVSERNLDKAGKLMLSKKGVASYAYSTNEQGQIIRTTYFDLQGLKTTNTDGVFACDYTYHKKGWHTGVFYLGSDQKPFASKDGEIAGMRWTYDKMGNKLREEYFGTDQNLIEKADNGIAAIDCRYDKHGYRTALYCKGLDNQAKTNRTWGFATLWLAYDPLGNLLSETYLGTDLLPAEIIGNGITSVRYQYDKEGNTIETKILDRDGNLVLSNHAGYAVVRQKYDADRNNIEKTYFDQYDQPLKDQSQGFAL